jgi:glycolate oxidase iron-sulfur subunit
MFALARFFRDSKLPALLIKTRVIRYFSPKADFALALLESSSSSKHFSQPVQDNGSVNKISMTTSVEGRSLMLFKGCVTDGLFRRVNEATQRVLALHNHETNTPFGQTCCGALHAHSGDLEMARELARRNIIAFASPDNAPIITNAGGCGAMLNNYGHLLRSDPEYSERAELFGARVRDVSEELSMDGVYKTKCHHSEPITYDASCHLHYGQHASEASLNILLATDPPNYVPLNGSDVCCGGAGVYNLLEPKLSSAILQEKLSNIERTGARILATGNPGCHMQIRAGSILAGNGKLDVYHPIEIVDESYRCSGLYNKQDTGS